MDQQKVNFLISLKKKYIIHIHSLSSKVQTINNEIKVTKSQKNRDQIEKTCSAMRKIAIKQLQMRRSMKVNNAQNEKKTKKRLRSTMSQAIQ